MYIFISIFIDFQNYFLTICCSIIFVYDMQKKINWKKYFKNLLMIMQGVNVFFFKVCRMSFVVIGVIFDVSLSCC